MLRGLIRLNFAVVIAIGVNLSARADPADLAAGGDAVQQGRWDEAIGLFSQVIAAPGRAKAELATAHSQRGYAYFAKGYVDPAIADYNTALKIAPNDGHVYALRGWAHFVKGAMKQAIADSAAAIRLDPTSTVALRSRGRAQLYSGKPKPAADDFAMAVRLAPSDVVGVIWLHVARVRAGENDLEELTRNIAKIDRKQWPGPLVEPLIGGMTPERVGDIAMAAEGEKTQREHRCDAQVYFGLLQSAAGDRIEAGRLFRAALEDCPAGIAEATEIAVAKLELKGMGVGLPTGGGQAMRGQGVVDPGGPPATGPAVRGQAAAAAATPEHTNADPGTSHRDRGYELFGRGQVDQAIAEYSAAIRLAKDDVDSYGLRGWAHFIKGNMNQAVVDSAAAIRLKPDSAFDLRNRGRAQLYAGKPRPAADDFATAVRLAPSDILGVLWLHIARVRAGQNDQQEFRRNLDRVDRKTWPGPLAGVLSGEQTPEKVGDIAMAADGQKTQLERRCDAQVYLGLLQLAAGDKREGEKLFKAAVADCPPGAASATELAVAKMELKHLGGRPAHAGPKPAEPKPMRAPAQQRGGST